MVTITVDQKQIEAEPETSLLKACLDNGIYIPHLCFMERLNPAPASCRMCFVEIQGERRPVTACTQTVKEGMVVRTDTEDVRRLQKAGLQLLLSVHHVDCRHCPANKKCPLQKMAKHLKAGLKPGRLERHLKTTQVDHSHPFLDYYPNRCVLCGKCVEVCRTRNGQAVFTFARRGFNTVIQYFGSQAANPGVCPPEHECVNVCPVAALLPKDAGAGDESTAD